MALSPDPTRRSFHEPLLALDGTRSRWVDPGSPTSPLSPPPRARATSARSSSPGSGPSSRPISQVVLDQPTSSHGSRTSSSGSPSRNSVGPMLLYRLSTPEDLRPPSAPFTTIGSRALRASFGSYLSQDSLMSSSGDSKYPGSGGVPGFVAYAYDPDPPSKEVRLGNAVDDGDDDIKEWKKPDEYHLVWSWRGISNLGALTVLISALLALFVGYPVISYMGRKPNPFLLQAANDTNPKLPPPASFIMPTLIDPETPTTAHTRNGNDQQAYTLVFSDEFNTPGRSFYPGDDPFWTAVDLWYWSTSDLEWYTPSALTTSNGALEITMNDVSSRPYNGMSYTSGMLQSWNQFCFSSGYIEVALVLPGPDSSTTGYWPGAWTMGNLGRPGYGATTDGTWPYSYDSCDVGTFPNQTFKDGSGPAAALHSDSSREKYNYELSWLPGQRLSSCTCPGEDHPGPSVKKGRGAPEIDIIEAERNKDSNNAGGLGQVVSQSAQFAPFTHDYLYQNSTLVSFDIYDSSITWANSYRGSAVQQAVSSLTKTPDDMFQGQPNGGTFRTFGFEYHANPSDPTQGFITWFADGKPSYRMGAGSVGPDTGAGGSGVGQRLVPEEPMSIVLNLGMSNNWQKILPETMSFPGVMKVDYVRVYQRTDELSLDSLSCDPKGYPTADYIEKHVEAYTNPNLTTWTKQGGLGGPAGYPWPKNSGYDGC